MATYHLQIITPDSCKFDGQAQKMLVRTISGDIEILAGHIDYIGPLGIGVAKLTDADGNVREAACNSGFLSVANGEVRVVSTTFEWADEIDRERAEQSKARAEKAIAGATRGARDYALADARLRRALARLSAQK